MVAESSQDKARFLDALKAELEACANQGFAETHPLNFYYLQALLENLSNRPLLSDALFNGLVSKAALFIKDYQQTRKAPADPAAEQPLPESGLSKLKALNRQLQQRTGISRQAPVTVQQSGQQTEPVSEDKNTKSELQALKHYQQLFEKMAVERLLNKVMQEIPENAGPLNPERVVIRCLSTLQDISPSYAMRLMGYYESLISLQSPPFSEK